MLVTVWREGNPPVMLLGVKIGIATGEQYGGSLRS